MMRDFWYAVASSASLGTEPLAVELLGEKLVLYRTADGRVGALADRCSHRGDRLSRGRVDGQCLRCPYHGWAYDPDGECIHIPSLQDQDRIPPRARVQAYETTEANGWVHVFMGASDAERPPLPDWPELADPDWRTFDFEWTIDASYTRVVENAVDISHLPFLHRNSYGPEQPVITPLQDAESSRWWGRGSYDHATRAPAPMSFFFRAPIPARTTFTWHLPCFTSTLGVSDKGTILLVMCHLPVNESKTRILYRLARNFAKLPVFDGLLRRASMEVFTEDRASVEEQRPRVAPEPALEVHVPLDALPLGFRRARLDLLADGWARQGG